MRGVPLGRLELLIDDLVPRRGVRVVWCDVGDGSALRAAHRMSGLGYTNVAVLEGGIAAWEQQQPRVCLVADGGRGDNGHDAGPGYVGERHRQRSLRHQHQPASRGSRLEQPHRESARTTLAYVGTIGRSNEL